MTFYPLDTAAFEARKALLLLERFCVPRSVEGTETALASTITWRPAEDRAWISVAGSIRRKRPRVNDIDIVAIPTMRAFDLKARTLFGDEVQHVPETGFFRAVTQLLDPVISAGEKIVRGTLNMEGSPRIQVDIYIATPETWAMLLLIRTGSKQHNIEIAKQAKDLGIDFHASGQPLTKGELTLPCSTEEEIFASLNLPYLPPEAR
jgi:DNA polymerase (family X)